MNPEEHCKHHNYENCGDCQNVGDCDEGINDVCVGCPCCCIHPPEDGP